jgi:uncharacterized membrane protein YesL
MERKNKLRDGLGASLRTLCDLMLLNLLFLVCSLPVVTVGPAASALFSASLRLARREPIAVLRVFFTAFRRGFKQALLLGLVGLAGGFVAVVDWRFASAQTGGFRILFFAVAAAVCLAAGALWAWAFALHAGFENSLGGTIKNAFALAFVEPKETALIWIAFAAPVLCAVWMPEYALGYLGWAYLLFAFSGPAYLAARRHVKVFARFGGPAERIEPEEDSFSQ